MNIIKQIAIVGHSAFWRLAPRISTGFAPQSRRAAHRLYPGAHQGISRPRCIRSRRNVPIGVTRATTRRGLASADGEVVLPEDPTNRDIPSDMVNEIQDVRACA